MGMTIDEILKYLTEFSIYSPYQEAIDKLTAYIEQMQADYENRLKADMAAMLMAIRGELTKYYKNPYAEFRYDTVQLSEVLRLIDREISALRGNDND